MLAINCQITIKENDCCTVTLDFLFLTHEIQLQAVHLANYNIIPMPYHSHIFHGQTTPITQCHTVSIHAHSFPMQYTIYAIPMLYL